MNEIEEQIDRELAIIEEMEAIQRARNSLLEFTQYNNDEYSVNWHHAVIADHLDAYVRRDIENLIIEVPPRHGKALAIDTPIRTECGLKTIGSLLVGDKVFTPSGKLTKVIAKSDKFVDRPCYKVTTDDGHSLVADAKHIWAVRLCRKRKVFSLRNSKFLADRKSDRKPMIPTYEALQYKPKNFAIAPYTLGVWLGDGHRAQAIITKSEEDAAHLKARIELDGFKVSAQATKNTFGILGLKKLLREEALLSAERKFIPQKYYEGSIEQRLALLQGLMDTDGYVAKDGQCEFCSTSKELALGFRYLVNSMGVKASLCIGRATLDGKDYGEKFRVMFYFSKACSLPRKAKFCKDATKRNSRYLTVEDASSTTTQCIQVEAEDGLFLAGYGLVVTHNSELVSRNLPPRILGQNRDSRVIIASYSADLANRMNLDCQRVIDSDSYRLCYPDTQLFNKNCTIPTTRPWKRTDSYFEVVEAKGSLRSIGVGGGITGMGGSDIIVDDPFKDRKEADSPTVRNTVWNWWTSTLSTRAQKGCGKIVCQTRWHEDDLVGRLLQKAKSDPKADQWEVLTLPAIKTDIGRRYDIRSIGEPLWPEWYDLSYLEKRRAASSRDWNALYQQTPFTEGGQIVQKKWWRWYTASSLPNKFDEIVMSVDATFKDAATSDFVVVQVWARSEAKKYLLNQWRARLGFTDTIQRMLLAKQMYPKIRAIYVEDKANGSAIIEVLKSKLSGVIAVNPQGSKQARAQAVAPQIEAGNVYLPDPEEAHWVDEFVDEWAKFPLGKNDDQVDGTSQALAKLSSNENLSIWSLAKK